MLIRQHSFMRMSLDDHQYTCSIQNKIDQLISSLYNWTGQLNFDVIKSFYSVQNVDLMKNANSPHCLIPLDLYFPKDRYRIDHGYHYHGFKNFILYLEHSSTKNRCFIFFNGGKHISSNFYWKHFRLFRCTHGNGYRGGVWNSKQPYLKKLLIPMIEQIIDHRVNLYREDLNLLDHLINWSKIVPFHCKYYLIQMVFFSKW